MFIKKNKNEYKEIVLWLNETFDWKLRKLQQGIPHNPWYCPIANTIRNAKGNRKEDNIVVDYDIVYFNSAQYKVPDFVKEFCIKFDNGEYEELIDVLEESRL